MEQHLKFCLSISRPLKNAQFWSRSRRAKISTTGIYGIFRGLKFESDVEIDQINADFERGRFSKVSSPDRSYLVLLGVKPSSLIRNPQE